MTSSLIDPNEASCFFQCAQLARAVLGEIEACRLKEKNIHFEQTENSISLIKLSNNPSHR